MSYKAKPHKGMAKRFRVTKTGKIKHRHEKNSHLRSGRSSKLKRQLGRPGVLAEGMARNVRRYLGVTRLKPLQVEHEARQGKPEPEADAPKQDRTKTTSSRRDAGTAKPSPSRRPSRA